MPLGCRGTAAAGLPLVHWHHSEELDFFHRSSAAQLVCGMPISLMVPSQWCETRQAKRTVSTLRVLRSH
uniref:Secreted protein n=1 Tax=Heterorhabditis bacteriophora TaxID=37862 RepID=A0A1I7X203_HETBA